ncbi:acyltransferase family protein [Mucilaginibacter sp. HD30]
MRNDRKINSIQYLRAIAAILVVYHHCLKFIGHGSSSQTSFYYLKQFGAIGVDIFFVISGFIIAYVSMHLNGVDDAVRFLKKRFVRINPTYYVASIIALILRFISKPNTFVPVDELLMTLTIVPVFVTEAVTWKPILYVGWTLAYEWLFYMVFAVLIATSVNKKGLLLVSIFVVTTIVGLVFPINNSQYNFIANPLALEFCLGVLIALILSNKQTTLRATSYISSIIIGLVWYVIIILTGRGYNDFNHPTSINLISYLTRFLLWGLPSASIVFGIIFLEQNGGVKFNNKIMLLLGDASFSIYLIHTLFISFVNKFIDHLKFIPLDFLIIFSVISATIAGVVYYKLIESPMLRWFNSLLLKRTKKV